MQNILLISLLFFLLMLSCHDDVEDNSTRLAAERHPEGWFVSIPLENRGSFEDTIAPPSWWMRNDYNETIFFGARSADGDILTFRLNYDGELSTPDHFELDRRGSKAAIDATINGFNYTTVTSTYENKVENFHVDLKSKSMSGDIDVVLISPDTDEDIKLVGRFETRNWNLLCVNYGQLDQGFSSEFCSGLDKYR